MSTHALWDFGNKDHLVESIRNQATIEDNEEIKTKKPPSKQKIDFLVDLTKNQKRFELTDKEKKRKFMRGEDIHLQREELPHISRFMKYGIKNNRFLKLH